MQDKIIRWLIFSVSLSLLPIVFSAIRLYSRGQYPSLIELTGNGELLLVSVTLAADAVGKLFGVKRRRNTSIVLVGGLCIFIIAFSSLMYADVTSSVQAKPLLREIVSQQSLTALVLLFWQV